MKSNYVVFKKNSGYNFKTFMFPTYYPLRSVDNTVFFGWRTISIDNKRYIDADGLKMPISNSFYWIRKMREDCYA